MKYMYTNSPDEGCHEIGEDTGIYGRPVHARDYKKLQAKGWVLNPSDVVVPEIEASDETAQLIEEYQLRFGKKPHHKMLPETIQKAIDEYDEAEAGKSDPDATGD